MLNIISKNFISFSQQKVGQISRIIQTPLPNYLFVGIILSIILRLICVPNKSSDFKWALTSWYNFIAEHGGLSALKYTFSDYTPLYLYWLVIASTLLSGLIKNFSIKLLAMACDYVCAFFVYKLVQLKYPSTRKPILAFLSVILSPIVIYNSALWGQCDVIYTTGIIACLYFLCITKKAQAFISFGVAISAKLQAIFFLPFLGILLLKKQIQFKYFLLIPLVYIISVLPAWFVGHNFIDLLLIYFRQGTQYKKLVQGAPNLYQWLPQAWYQWVLPLGIIITIIVVILLIYKTSKNPTKLRKEHLIDLAMISVLLVPYTLPKMHERYFFTADIISLVYGFYFPQRWWVAITVQSSSFFSYLGTPILQKIFSIVLGFTLGFILSKSEFVFHSKYKNI